MEKCINLKHRPKNKIIRELIGSTDNCEHYKNIKGIHISGKKDRCIFESICKYYELEK